ncbi:MAG: mono/diheme cytochrome c family protein [Rhodothermales bacterium]|jgi:mono/diheme cytochrome c family protein
MKSLLLRVVLRVALPHTCITIFAVLSLASPRAFGAKDTIDPVVLKERATKVMATYCVSCHGPDKQKGKVRLDALETIDPVDLQKLFGTAKEAVHFEDMPPEEEKQPSKEERKVLMQWLDSQLTGKASKALAEKLLRFEYGNVVKHEDLFSGKHAQLPAYTHDRRWLVSEYIFSEKVNSLLDYKPTRNIYGVTRQVAGDSGHHWSPKTEHGDKFRRTITNPFLLPQKIGVRYHGKEALTTGHLLTMVGNAKRIAGYMSSEAVVRAHYPAAYALLQDELEHRKILRTRKEFLSTDTYMDRFLQDIYADKHEALLPGFVRVDVPFPGMRSRKFPGQKTYRITDPQHFRGLDAEDREAVYRSIVTYKIPSYDVTEDTTKVKKDAKGEPWSPYLDEQRANYETIILQAEREWAMRGVSVLRIENRIAMMKMFWDYWDMNLIYDTAKKHSLAPAYEPLDDAEMKTITGAIKKHRQKGDNYQTIIDKCMADWTASFEQVRDATDRVDDARINALIDETYAGIFERQPSESERGTKRELVKQFMGKLKRQEAIAKFIESLVLDTEFVYRHEFGAGDADEHGRRMMPPRDASYALAYALSDSSPDAELAKAAREGRLKTRADYERELRRMLKRRDQWTIIDERVQSINLNPSVTNQPIRKLRFFRDFFGYPHAIKVFKDRNRFGAGDHERAVSRVVEEADMLVEYVLEEDEQVFETLLTTDEFYVFHNGDNAAMQTASDAYKRIYERFKDEDWQAWKPEDVAPHEAFLMEHWEFQREKAGAHDRILKKFQKLMAGLTVQFGDGQANAAPYMKNGMGYWHGGPVLGRSGQQMRNEEVASYWNIDWRTWDYPTKQPAKISNRKGLLTHPAWLIAHSQNLETDPIHRGKWIREKLLAGTIPDVPITVDAVIHPNKDKTLRQRMEKRTGESYCWRCHQKMDPLGFPLESYDDFGRFRLKAMLEHADNLIKKANRKETNEFGVSLAVYKSLPVDARGVLKGTDDPRLDGEVDGAFDLIDRLAKSDKVRQSFIRHAFRYFLGRNETLADSKTLIDADKAYLKSNGSFDEVIVSLLTSDAFIYRKPNPKDQ